VHGKWVVHPDQGPQYVSNPYPSRHAVHERQAILASHFPYILYGERELVDP